MAAPSQQWLDFLADLNALQFVCDHVQAGKSLRSFCEARGLSYMALDAWLHSDTVRAAQYARARDARADHYFEELHAVSAEALETSDGVHIQGLRLKADNLKWMLARMSPKRYGDKLQVGGAADLPPVQSSVVIDAAEAYKRILGGDGG